MKADGEQLDLGPYAPAFPVSIMLLPELLFQVPVAAVPTAPLACLIWAGRDRTPAAVHTGGHWLLEGWGQQRGESLCRGSALPGLCFSPWAA